LTSFPNPPHAHAPVQPRPVIKYYPINPINLNPLISATFSRTRPLPISRRFFSNYSTKAEGNHPRVTSIPGLAGSFENFPCCGAEDAFMMYKWKVMEWAFLPELENKAPERQPHSLLVWSAILFSCHCKLFSPAHNNCIRGVYGRGKVTDRLRGSSAEEPGGEERTEKAKMGWGRSVAGRMAPTCTLAEWWWWGCKECLRSFHI